MKTSISTLLASIAFALTASAAPTLLVETTITKPEIKDGRDIRRVIQLSMKVESGSKAIMRAGALEYALTPTLLDDGTVDLRAILTERDGKKADKLAAPRIKAKLGQLAKIQIGQLGFTTKTSLAK